MPSEFEVCYNCGRWYVLAFELYHGPYGNRCDAIDAAENMVALSCS